jgi:hypothetical protein
MGFVEVGGLGDDYEDKIVAEGEYELRINDAKEQTSKDGALQYMCIIDIEAATSGDEIPQNTAPIFHYLTMPKEDDSSDSRRTKMRFLTRFLKAFSIPFEADGFNVEDFSGTTATLLVEQDKYGDNMTNRIKLPPTKD